MGTADAYLVELGAPQDPWDRQLAEQIAESVVDADDCVREEELLRWAAQPMVRFAINFASDRWPGVDAAADATWAVTVAMARRQIRVNRDFGIDLGLGELSLEVLDWIERRIGAWDHDMFSPLVRARTDELLDARRRGRERGGMRHENAGAATSRAVTSGGWALRHPSDHYFRSARQNAHDGRLGELLDAQVNLLATSYDRLAAQPAAFESAEMVIELEVQGPIARGWSEPVTTRISAVTAGPVSVGERLGLRLVADPAATFNGTLVSLRPGEKWLTYAARMPDGTIVPADGTRRLAG